MKPRRSSAHAAVTVVTRGIMLLALLCVATIAALALAQRPIPDALDRMAQMLVAGALGLLAKTSSGDEEPPTEVQVVNEATSPLPVAEVGESAVQVEQA